MDGTAVIASMIFLCVGILTVMVFSEPLKVIGRILLGAVLGMVGIYAVNMMFPSVNIGINLSLSLFYLRQLKDCLLVLSFPI